MVQHCAITGYVFYLNIIYNQYVKMENGYPTDFCNCEQPFGSIHQVILNIYPKNWTNKWHSQLQGRVLHSKLDYEITSSWSQIGSFITWFTTRRWHVLLCANNISLKWIVINIGRIIQKGILTFYSNNWNCQIVDVDKHQTIDIYLIYHSCVC